MADELAVVGKSLTKPDAFAKVSGQTRFADDLALPRMLFGRILRSPHPHARIVRIDTSRARALPGVLAVLTGDDLPIKFGILPVSQDEEALAREKVRYVGDPIAAVAATDEWIADEALELIEVQFTELPPIMSIEQATPTRRCWRRNTSARMSSSSKATRICRWSSTRPSPNTRRTES